MLSKLLSKLSQLTSLKVCTTIASLLAISVTSSSTPSWAQSAQSSKPPREIEIHNVIAAASSQLNSRYSADHLVDSNNLTAWRGGPQTGDWELVFDFTEPRELSSISFRYLTHERFVPGSIAITTGNDEEMAGLGYLAPFPATQQLEYGRAYYDLRWINKKVSRVIISLSRSGTDGRPINAPTISDVQFYEKFIRPAWQNLPNRYDTNNDGVVAPLDLLLLINACLDGVIGPLPPTKPPEAPFLDVNGDGSFGTFDLLDVLHFLNRSGAS